MKVLVTGASGFLGGALVRELVKKGDSVRILVRRQSKLDHLKDLQLEIIYGDLGSKDSLIPALKNIEIVYHCAARSADWGQWEWFYKANVLGVQNILDVAVNSGSIKRFLHISTSDVYGYPIKPRDETFPIVDTGLPYNKSKVLGEKIVWGFYEKYKLPITVIRPVCVYGPRSKDFVTEIANLLIRKQMMLINGGEAVAGLLYIDNAVEGIIQATTSTKTIGQAYNLRDESNETWCQYVKALAKGLKVTNPWINLSANLALYIGYINEKIYEIFRIRKRPLFTRHAVYILAGDHAFPIEKAQKDFGFQSKVSYDKGVENTLAWLNFL